VTDATQGNPHLLELFSFFYGFLSIRVYHANTQLKRP